MDGLNGILPYLVSAVTALAGWWGGRTKARRERIADRQDTIDMLVSKVDAQTQRIVELQDAVVQLRAENANLRAELESYRRQVAKLITALKKKNKKNDTKSGDFDMCIVDDSTAYAKPEQKKTVSSNNSNISKSN
jgi:regulator of replication initiation timing